MSLPLVTPQQMRAAEQASVAAGIREPELMRRAGLAIAAWCQRLVVSTPGQPPRALGLIGPGNNGGDGLVALAALRERGWDCAACFVDRTAIGALPASAVALASLRPVSPNGFKEFRPDVILDGIFGIGGRTALGDSALAGINSAHIQRLEHGTPLVAIDTPSGVDSETGEAHSAAFRADVTLTLGLPKIGLLRDPAASHVGELVVVDIGINASSNDGGPRMLTPEYARTLLPHRSAVAHKSDTGAVMVVGGSHTFYGAPRLAGAAALRVGAGLVTIATPTEVVPVIAGQVPELTFLPLAGAGAVQARAILETLISQQRRYTALVVGPGMGRDDRAKGLLDTLIEGLIIHQLQHIPIVLDADALFWLAGIMDVAGTLNGFRIVLTPHAGEMSRLTHLSVAEVLVDPLGHSRRFSSKWRQTVVLKSGYSSVSAAGGAQWVAPRAMPELATPGTGDVLAGLVGGFLAQGLASEDAACLAMVIGALSGRALRAAWGVSGVIAGDVIDQAARVLGELTEPEWRVEWMSQVDARGDRERMLDGS